MDKITHTIISGPAGSGKSTQAKAFAATQGKYLVIWTYESYRNIKMVIKNAKEEGIKTVIFEDIPDKEVLRMCRTAAYTLRINSILVTQLRMIIR